MTGRRSGGYAANVSAGLGVHVGGANGVQSAPVGDEGGGS